MKTSWSNLMNDFVAKCDIAVGGVSTTLDRQKRAFFTQPYMVDGKTPIVRCDDVEKYQTVAQIDQPNVRTIVNPGGTNERFAKQFFTHSQLIEYPDNVTIFKQILDGHADVMVTDASETLLQQKLNPGLCSVHPGQAVPVRRKGLSRAARRRDVPAIRRPMAAPRAIDRRVSGGRRQVAEVKAVPLAQHLADAHRGALHPRGRRRRMRLNAAEAVRHVVRVDQFDAAAVAFQKAREFEGVVVERIVRGRDDQRRRRRPLERFGERERADVVGGGCGAGQEIAASTTSFRRSSGRGRSRSRCSSRSRTDGASPDTAATAR